MAISVLLVDDEKVDLEWLRRRVVGSPHPVEVVGTANNGFAALKLLERQRVDVILSDIRMPIMSGIEFARKAKELNPDVRIVFISGHEDFGYAKEAIHLNASGYLLKPVDDGELDDMLAQLCAAVEGERERSRSLAETLTLANRELLLRWLGGGVGAEEAPDARLREFLSPLAAGGGAVALVEIDDLERKSLDMSEEERRAAVENVHRRIEQFAERTGGLLTAIAVPASPRFALLAAGEENGVSPALEELIRELAANSPFTVTIGCGAFVADWRRLPESYREALAALSAKWLLGKNRLLREAAERRAGEGVPPDLDETGERLLQAILAYDLVEIDDCLMRIFGPESPLARKDDAYSIIVRVTSKLHAELLQRDENLYELLQWDSHQPVVLFQFETVGDIVSWLRRRLFELSELLLIKRTSHDRKLIEKVKRFVEERIEQKVTLKETAKHFDFTPNYLGFLFKEETGLHFSDFLIELRMKRVCELLADPTLKIYEIADRVGYKNIIYFNRQFKQSTGMTPGEYRKQRNI